MPLASRSRDYPRRSRRLLANLLPAPLRPYPRRSRRLPRFAPRLGVWRYELRVLGPWLLATPPALAAGLGGLAALLDARHTNPTFVAQLLTAMLEACLPLAASLAVADAAAHDAAVELQLALPTAYRVTVLRRCALLLGWTALVALAATLAIRRALPAAVPEPPAAAQLVWLAPLLWLAGAGALLALALRSRAAGAAVLGSVWVAQLVFHGYFAAYGWTRPWFLFATLYTPRAAFWPANRAELVAAGLVAALAIWLVLRDPERRFRREEA